MNSKPKIIAIVGQTASGKTSLSIKIAKKYNGEVISADSRQVYRGMDLGTGKVTETEMSGVPHHLLDIRNPSEKYTAAEFSNDAKMAINDVYSRSKLPIVAGGTFFYLDLLRGHLQSSPVPPNQTFRDSLENFTNEELFKKLAAADAARSSTIDPHNRHRLIRSLEIIETLGKVPVPTPTESPYDWLILGIDINKEKLHNNINLRLHERMAAGMVDEVERLHKEGISFARLESFGLEYRYLSLFLQNKISETEMLTEIENKSRQFAKRQMTWLKRDKDIVWVKTDDLAGIFQKVDDFLHGQAS